MEDDVLLLDKPAGMTSFGVVARLRRVFSQQAGKKVKVGHTGTLDPFATGLMIICVGKACKNASHYSKLDKVYEATIQLGATSTTGDPEGDIQQTHQPVVPTADAVAATIAQFRGVIRQRPPIFSAIKINGQRAYKLARDGQAVELPERQVEIYSLEILSYTYPELVIRTHVSSGTYIRSLAVAIGEQLGTGAYCTALRRTKVADYQVAAARQLGDFGITS